MVVLVSSAREEIKDTLMGHLRESAKSSYSLSIASVVRIYHEEFFPKLAVNGWSLKQKASDVDRLVQVVEDLRDALGLVEKENNGARANEVFNQVVTYSGYAAP